MDYQTVINNATEQEVKMALSCFLNGYLTPAFGALSKTDSELLVLEMLLALGVIEQRFDVYDLVTSLRVTRSKARSLIYNRALREFSNDDALKQETKEVLKNIIIQKDGEFFQLYIENPLVSDFIQSQLRKCGYLSDGSFSPSIVKLTIKALCALIESLLNDKEREEVTRVLILSGAPNGSFQGVVKSALLQIARKVAAEAGDAAVKSAFDYLSPIISAKCGDLKKVGKGLFNTPTS